MPNISVRSEELKKQFNIMDNEVSAIESARKKMLSQYQQLGSHWKDAKYKELGAIVYECDQALSKTEKTLLYGQKNLLAIIKAVQEYESTRIYGTGAGEERYTRHLTQDEVNSRWQTGVESIDETIENYRTELMERGVPAGAWLDSVLGQHRKAMLKQESYDLEMAGGHIDPENYNLYEFYQAPGDYHSFYDSLAEEFRNYCLSGTNPNYMEAAVYKDNCQRCVPAYELRRRGLLAEAQPSDYGSEHLAYNPFDVWENAEVITAPGSGLESIQNVMHVWGDGARAEVAVLWDDPFGSNGHVFMAEQRNGETIFYDPQTGVNDVSDYFQDVIPNTTQYCRIDNLQTTDYINDCYFERSTVG